MERFIVVFILAVVMSACSMTPTQKKWTGIAAGVLIVGAVAAYESDSGKPDAGLAVTDPSAPCTMQPNGTCR